MKDTLTQLAKVNISGAPFLIAYGITWVICGVIWKKASSKLASLATLFQGMIAFPIAMFIMYLIGAFDNRPETGILNELVIIIAISQMLVLPLLIAMYIKRHYTLIPFVFSSAGSIHFLLYTWLYQTYAYFIMSIFIALVQSMIYGWKAKDDITTPNKASLSSFSTGILLLLTAAYFIVMH